MENRKKEFTTLSEINVTPLVDVMLVLLIIFMVTAPMLHEGLDVELPQVRAESIVKESSTVTVTVTKDGRVFIDQEEVTLDDLTDRMAQMRLLWPDKKVLLKGDKSVSYGTVVEVMAALRNAGIVDLGMVTEPLQEEQ
ncbi:MAG: protein TolR [Deltaproteobacteria bacterium]|nr:protein TolR [Candidatus Zymogenaceae bacterium]